MTRQLNFIKKENNFIEVTVSEYFKNSNIYLDMNVDGIIVMDDNEPDLVRFYMSANGPSDRVE